MVRRSPVSVLLSLVTVSALLSSFVVAVGGLATAAEEPTTTASAPGDFVTVIDAPARLFPGERGLVTVGDGRTAGGDPVTTDHLVVEPAPLGGLSVFPGTVKRADGASGAVTAAIGTRGELVITFSQEGITSEPGDALVIFEVEVDDALPLTAYPLSLTVGASQDGGDTLATATHVFGTGTEVISLQGPDDVATDVAATYVVRDARGPDEPGRAITDSIELALPEGWQVSGVRAGADGPPASGTSDAVAFDLGGVTTAPGDVIATFDLVVPSTLDAAAYAGPVTVTTTGGGLEAGATKPVVATPTLALRVAPPPVTGGTAAITLAATADSPAVAVASVVVRLPAAWTYVADSAALPDGTPLVVEGDGAVVELSAPEGGSIAVAPGADVVTLEAVAAADGTITAEAGTAPTRVARLAVDVEEAYALSLELPEAVVPGATFQLSASDGRPAGLDPVGVEFVELTLPDGFSHVPSTARTGDGTGDGLTAVADPDKDGARLRFTLPEGTATTPGQLALRVDLAVSDDASPGAVTLPLLARPTVGRDATASAVTRVAAGPPDVDLFGAVRIGDDTVGVVGLLVGTPGTAYAISLVGFADGCPVDGGQPIGTVSLLTDDAGVARFGAVSGSLAPVPDAVRVVDAGEFITRTTPPGTESSDPSVYYDEGATYLAADGYPGSDCLHVGLGNDSWPTAFEVGADGAAREDRITVAGADRWFRFPVTPGTRVTIDLFDLPADYDLVAFTDIEEAFLSEALVDPVALLDRTGAQNAPSAFSPSAFSPSAFSPSAFSPSAFSPSAFSPSAFSPSVYAPSAFSPSAFSPSAFSPSAFSPSAFSPSAFSPSAFSPDAYSPSAFSPSAFSPSAFSPSAFSPDDYAPSAFSPSAFSPSAFSPSAFSPSAFSAAQTQSVISMSAIRGTAAERLVVNTWDNDGWFYVRVSGAGGAFDPTASFKLSIAAEGTSCDGVAPVDGSPSAAAAGDHETIVLWDSTVTPSADLAGKLGELAGAENGVVVDVATDDRVGALRAQSLAYPDCVYATNLLAQGIKDVVDAYRDAHPLAYVVLVGGDDAIPFFRYPDEGLLGPESDYEPPVRDGTISQSALRTNQVLGQDEYGAEIVLEYGGTRQPIPDLAVGRLVETPAEIIRMIDVHLNGGVIQPDSTLVTGYDFLADAAAAVQEQFVLGTDVGDGSAVNDELIPFIDEDDDGVSDVPPGDIAPSDPASWTAEDLRDALLRPALKHDLVYLAGHFSANSALAADYSTSLVTTELLDPSVDLEGSLVFSGGCHSGYSIVDDHIVPGLTLDLDWAQVMARKGATLVAGTGYQYGDTDLIEYGERLYLQFAKELRRAGEQSVGEALVRAKLDYLAGIPEPRGLHHKSLLIATVFGLPMTSVDMPGVVLPDDPAGTDVQPTADGVRSAAGTALGLASASLDVTPVLPDEPTAVELDQITIDAVTGTAVRSPAGSASYYPGPDGEVLQPNEPILPLSTHDVTAQGRSLRGVAIRGATYRDEAARPLSAAAATELRGVHVPFASEVFFPMRITTANYYGALGDDGRTRLHVTPVQHRAGQVGDDVVTRRVFESLDLELFYSNHVGPGADATAPRIVAVSTRPVAGADDVVDDVEFAIRVLGDPAAGMEQVWVTYTEALGGSSWRSIDLRPVAGDSGLWTAVLEDAAGPDDPALDYFVQAVNGVGLVGMDDNFGAYYRTGGPETTEPSRPDVPTTIVSLDVTGDLFYGGEATVSARLTLDDEQQTPVSGTRVLLGFGGTAVLPAVSDGDGVATATFPVTSPSGSVPVLASFLGTDVLVPASASDTVTVSAAPTTLGLTADGTGGIDVSLRTVTGVPAGEQTVLLTGVDGQQLTAITSPAGVINVPASRFTSASGVVSATFGGTDTFAPVTDPVEVQRDPSPTTLVLEVPETAVTYGEAVTVTATLTNTVGPVGGARIAFSVDGAPAEAGAATDAQGRATLTIDPVTTDDGRVEVTASFAATPDDQEATASASLTVAPKPTELELDGDTSVLVGDGATVTATVTSGTAPVVDETVVFTVDGVEVARRPTGADGVAGYTAPTPTSGTVRVTATLVASVEYATATSSIDVAVNRRTTALQLRTSPDVVLAGDTVTVTATLTSDGVPVVGETVVFTQDGTETPVTTVAGGFAEFTVTSSASGTIAVAASFGGTDEYLGSGATTEITVDKRSTALELWLFDPVFVDDDATIMVRLTSSGVAVVGQIVQFTVAGTSYSSDPTDEDGFASVSVTQDRSGDVEVAVAFAEGPVYTGSSTVGSFTVIKRPSALTLAQSGAQPGPDGGIESGVVGVLEDPSTGAPIAGAPVSFLIDGVATGDPVPTDAEGRAALGAVDLPTGEYAVTAVFAGDRVHEGDEATTTLVIDPLTSLASVLQALLGIVDDVASAQDRDKVLQAIGHVEDAIDGDRWSGGRAADTQVLTAIRKAVIALEKVRDEDPAIMAVVDGSVDVLVETAQRITIDAIEAAEVAGVDAASLAKAYEEYEKGLRYLAREQYDNAIGRWELAFAAVLDAG